MAGNFNVRGDGVKKRMTDKQSSETPSDIEAMKDYKRFEKRVKRLRKENNESQADIVTLKYIRKTALSLMPIAVSQYKQWKNDRSMIALRNLIEQIKDTMMQLRTQERGRNECEHIIHALLEPDLKVLMRRNISNLNQMKTQLSFLKESDKDKVVKMLDNASMEMGQNFTGVNAMLSEKIQEYLVGEK